MNHISLFGSLSSSNLNILRGNNINAEKKGSIPDENQRASTIVASGGLEAFRVPFPTQG